MVGTISIEVIVNNMFENRECTSFGVSLHPHRDRWLGLLVRRVQEDTEWLRYDGALKGLARVPARFDAANTPSICTPGTRTA